MKNKILSVGLALVLGLTSIQFPVAANEIEEETASSYIIEEIEGTDGENIESISGLSNPRIQTDSSMEAGQKVTYDCIWLGSYPQAEVVPDKSKYTAIGSDYLENGDIIENASLYSQLQSATYNSKNETTIGGTRYRRMLKGDATYGTSGSSGYYNWSDSTTYHYFKYEPIKWRVIEKDSSSAFLLADKGLDDQRYNETYTDVTWETCTLRDYLNSTFYDNAFNTTEKGMIIKSTVENANNLYYGTSGGNNTSDNVFLLAEKEVYKTKEGKSFTDSTAAVHGFVDSYYTYDEARRARSTVFSKAMGTFWNTSTSYKGNCHWWMRSPGYSSSYAAIVGSTGHVDSDGNIVSYYRGAVRPALKIHLSSLTDSMYAGTVCSDGTVNETAKPGDGGGSVTPTPGNIIASDILESVTYIYGSKKVDVLKYAQSIDYKHGAFKLSCKPKSGKSISKYYLTAESTAIKESTDGEFADISPASLENKTLYVVTEDNSGNKEKTPIGLKVTGGNIGVIPLFDVDKGVDFKLDEDFPIIGGLNIKFDFPELPMTVNVDDNKLRIGVNIKEGVLKSWEDGKDTTAESKKEVKKSYSEKWEEWIKNDFKDGKITKELLNADKKKLEKELQNICKKNDIKTEVPGIKGKVKWTCVGYFEAAFSQDDEVFEKAEGGLIFAVEASESWEKQTGFTIAFVYVPVTIQINGSVKGKLTGRGGYDFVKNNWYGEVPLDISVTLSPYVGAGVGKWVSVGVYGSCTLGTDIIVISSSEESGLKDIYMKGEAGLRAYLAKKEATLKLFDIGDMRNTKTWGKYVTTSGKILLYSRSATSIFGGDKNSNSYRLDEAEIDHVNEILSSEGKLTDSSLNLKWREMPLEEHIYSDDENIGIRDVYEAANPVISSEGCVLYLKETVDSTKLSYGYIGSGSLSNVQTVTEDNTSDFGHRLYEGKSGTYVIYQDSRKVIPVGSEISDKEYVGSFGISVARYNSETKGFEDLGSPDVNNVYCYNPVLYENNKGLVAIWAENNNNDMSAAGNNNLMYSVYEDSAWSTPEFIAKDIKGVGSVAAFASGADNYVIYSEVTDTVDLVSNLYLVKNNESPVLIQTGNIGCIECNNNFNGFYYGCNGGIICYTLEDKSQKQILPEETMDYYSNYIVDGNKIYYTKAEENHRILYEAVKLENGSETGISAIVDTEGYVDSFSINDGNLAYVLTTANMVTGTESSEGTLDTRADMYITEVPIINDLLLADCDFYYGDVTKDGKLPISLSVLNKGTEVVNGITADFNVNGVSQKVKIPIVIYPGTLAQADTEFKLPSEIAGSSISVSVIGEEENSENMKDNSLELDVSRTELSVETAYMLAGAKPSCEINVLNRSAVDTTAELVVTDKDDKTVYSDSFAIGAHETVTKAFELSENMIPAKGDSVLTATVSTVGDEYYYNNNVAYQRLWLFDAEAEKEISDDELNTDILAYQIKLNKSKVEMKKASSVQLEATVTDKNGKMVKDAEITWISSDESVASVENGKVSSKMDGTTVITASYMGLTAECNVKVFGEDEELEPEEITEYIIKDIGNTGYRVEYSPSVSYNGVSHIEKGGKTSKTKVGDVSVTVYDPSGKVVSPDRYKVKFKNNKDCYRFKFKQPYFTITLKDKVDKSVKQQFKNTYLKFDIEPRDLSTIKINVDYKFKNSILNVKKVYWINETGKKVVIKPGLKGGFYAKYDEVNKVLKLEGVENYNGETSISL